MKHAEPYAFRRPHQTRIVIPLKHIGWRERAVGWAFLVGLAGLRLAELAVAAVVVTVSATYTLGRKLIGGSAATAEIVPVDEPHPHKHQFTRDAGFAMDQDHIYLWCCVHGCHDYITLPRNNRA